MTATSDDPGRTVRENTARLVDGLTADYEAVAKELIGEYEREERLLGGIAKREEKIAALTAKLAEATSSTTAQRERARAAEHQVEQLQERLQRLESTKALRLQRSYWRLRRGLRRPNAR